MHKIIVIGGGASGMMAAISAARQGADVTILEKNERVGKKILSTGNGRCNFTNVHQEPIDYRCEDPVFPWGIVTEFSSLDTIAFFRELGIYSKNRNGYLYPYSDQASSVLDVLRMELTRLQIKTELSVSVEKIIRGKNRFRILTNKGEFSADKIILAAGSKAAAHTGSDGSGYDLAKELGHHLIPVVPALVQLRCKEDFYKSIAGIRIQGKVLLFVDDVLMALDTGEIQMTNYGISGIPVFQVSRFASRGIYEKQKVEVILDFMPDFTEEQFISFLNKRILQHPERKTEEFLTGLFHKKISVLFCKLAGLNLRKPAGELTEEEVESLAETIKRFRTQIEGTNGFDQGQVCAGGVDTGEINPDTLESLLVPGLYFCGEILDVDGMCGGYNLQWAWSSGFVAGREAAK